MYYTEVTTEDFRLLSAHHEIDLKQTIAKAKNYACTMDESYHIYVYELIPEETYVYEKELMHITKDMMEFINV